MRTLLEGLTLTVFIAAICVLIYRFVNNKSTNAKAERIFSYSMTVGFALGAIKEIMFPPVRWIFILYIIGIIFAHTEVTLSYSHNATDNKTKNKQGDTNNE